MPPIRLRIIHLEDSPRDAELISAELERQGFAVETTRADDAESFERALASVPDLILADYAMPGFDVGSAIAILVLRGLDIPLIIVSASIPEDAAVALLHRGADDYLLKNRLGRLGTAITGALERRELRRQKERDVQSLREREELYAALFQHSPLPMFVFDGESLRFSAVNDEAVRQYGWSRDEFLGLTIAEIRPPEERDRMRRYHDENVRSLPFGIAKSLGIWRHWKKDGTTILADVSVIRLNLGGRPVMHAVCQDVTAREELEQKFIQSQKMESVGRLAGGVAHDFNNLLTVILGYGDLLRMKLGPTFPGLRELTEMHHAAQRAADLTRQLLAFSRRQVMQTRVMSLNESVQAVQSMLRRLIGEDIEVVVEAATDLGRIKSDPGQIEQVALNLAINARDAMKDGGRLTLATANRVLSAAEAAPLEIPPGRYVTLQVRDTGSGMPPEVMKHLFEPFFTTKEQSKGTGLGLSTVYGIVRQSGGAIAVDSAPGRGSTFTVHLPRVEADSKVRSMAPRSVADLRGTETILLVEDEPIVRNLAAKILIEAGYRVHAAAAPEEALKILDQVREPIQLLLTDVIMPQMNGRALANLIVARQPRIRVVFTSGYTDDEIVRHGVLDQGVPFLAKPYTWSSLLTKVREVLDTEDAAS